MEPQKSPRPGRSDQQNVYFTNCIIQSATEFLGSKNVKIIKDAKFGAEDFAFISNQVPSSYFKLGIKKNNEPEPLHHSGDFK